MARFLPLVLLLATGCNKYELFRLSGYQQDSFSNRADILFVVDNSPSMEPFVNDMADNFEGFVKQLSATEENVVREDLGDAVSNYIDYIENPGAFVDYQLGITTTDVERHAGSLLGTPKIHRRGDDRLARKFIDTLEAEAICQDANCASQEEPIEATFLAMCRSVANPPTECFEEFQVGDTVYTPMLTESDIGSNGDFLRNKSTFLPVIITDEGDASRRMSQGNVVADDYLDLTSRFNRHVAWVVIGPPTRDDHTPICPSPSPDWGTVRFEFLIQQSNGLHIDIQNPGDCEPTDFQNSLEQLGNLLQTLITSFPLDSVPVEDTILVFVDGQAVEQSEVDGTDEFGLETLSPGWQYLPDTNSIRFFGAAIPQNDAKVEVYYEPIDGMPRSIPLK